MKGKNLAIMLVVAVVLIGIAVLTSMNKSGSAPKVIGKLVLPNLPVNDIERITVVSGQATTVVARVEGEWLVPEKYNYPADFGKIRDTLLELSQLEIGQVIRASKNRKASLGMVPPSMKTDAREGRTGTLIEMETAGGETRASLLIGETRMRETTGSGSRFGKYPDGCYVSPDKGENVYLVRETLDDIVAIPQEWMNTDILNVGGYDIQEIMIYGPERDSVSLRRTEEGGDWELEGIRRGKITDAAQASRVASSLSYLRFKDLADPSLTDEDLGMDRPVVLEAVTKQGGIYTVRIGDSPEGTQDRYVRVSASIKSEPGKEAPENNAEEAGADEDLEEEDETAPQLMTKKEKEREKTREEINALNQRHSQWTYIIAAREAESMLLDRDKLMKEEEKDKDKKE